MADLSPAASLDELMARSVEVVQAITEANMKLVIALRLAGYSPDDTTDNGTMDPIIARANLSLLASPAQTMLTNLQQAWRDLEVTYAPVFGNLKSACEIAKNNPKFHQS